MSPSKLSKEPYPLIPKNHTLYWLPSLWTSLIVSISYTVLVFAGGKSFTSAADMLGIALLSLIMAGLVSLLICGMAQIVIALPLHKLVLSKMNLRSIEGYIVYPATGYGIAFIITFMVAGSGPSSLMHMGLFCLPAIPQAILTYYYSRLIPAK